MATHIELSGEVKRGIYYTEASDRRAVFIMPWKGHTLVGTTEQPYVGDPEHVAPLPAEVEYLQETQQRYFPGREGALLASWAGLRVLPRGEGKAFDRPREVILAADDADRPRVVTIYGGKLTGYRATAERVIRLLRRSLPGRDRVADTSTLRLPTNPSGS